MCFVKMSLLLRLTSLLMLSLHLCKYRLHGHVSSRLLTKVKQAYSAREDYHNDERPAWGAGDEKTNPAKPLLSLIC
jgi:hypothetical protein